MSNAANTTKSTFTLSGASEGLADIVWSAEFWCVRPGYLRCDLSLDGSPYAEDIAAEEIPAAIRARGARDGKIAKRIASHLVRKAA